MLRALARTSMGLLILAALSGCEPEWSTTTHVRFASANALTIVPRPGVGPAAADETPHEGDVILGHSRAESADGSGGAYSVYAIRMPNGEPGLRWVTRLSVVKGEEQPLIASPVPTEANGRQTGPGFDLRDEESRVAFERSLAIQLGSDAAHPARPTLRIPSCAELTTSTASSPIWNGRMHTEHQDGFRGLIQIPCSVSVIPFDVESPWSNVREVRVEKVPQSVGRAVFDFILAGAVGSALGVAGVVTVDKDPHSGGGVALAIGGFALSAVALGCVIALIPSMRAQTQTKVLYPPPP